jgi:hypothetical protein
VRRMALFYYKNGLELREWVQVSCSKFKHFFSAFFSSWDRKPSAHSTLLGLAISVLK